MLCICWANIVKKQWQSICYPDNMYKNIQYKTRKLHYGFFFIFVVAPCILKIHLLSHTNKCTNYIIYYLKSGLITDIKTLSNFHSSYMFRHITCHPHGALTFLPKITAKTICIYVHFLPIVLPVILARNMSAPWGWHVICRNM
jgi:hypothetical protein